MPVYLLVIEVILENCLLCNYPKDKNLFLRQLPNLQIFLISIKSERFEKFVLNQLYRGDFKGFEYYGKNRGNARMKYHNKENEPQNAYIYKETSTELD